MPAWRLAPTLIRLRSEINTRFPLRDKTSDGTLGNAAHAASRSDHNPDSRGVVCAIDIDEDLQGSKATAYPRFNSGQAAKAALVDVLLAEAKDGRLPQLFYVIYEGKIYSRTNGFAARTYSGVNAHDHHVHVSVYHDARHADSTRRWLPPLAPPAPKVTVSLEAIQTALKTVGRTPDDSDGSNDGVELQKRLNVLMGTELTPDGVLGRNTRAVAAAFQGETWDIEDVWTPTAKTWHPDADGIPGELTLRRMGFGVVLPKAPETAEPVVPKPPTTRVRVLTANIRTSAAADTGAREWEARDEHVTDLLHEASASVMFLQEGEPEQETFILAGLRRRDPEADWQIKSSGNRSVLYSGAKWKQVGYQRLMIDVPGAPGTRSIPCPQLESVSSGQKAWFVSVHLAPHAEYAAVRQAQTLVLAEFLNTLPGPKIVGGDVNSKGTKADPGPVRGLLSQHGYRAIRSFPVEVVNGHENSFNAWRDAPDDGVWLDDVWVKGGSIYAAWLIETHPYTDHNFLQAGVEFGA